MLKQTVKSLFILGAAKPRVLRPSLVNVPLRHFSERPKTSDERNEEKATEKPSGNIFSTFINEFKKEYKKQQEEEQVTKPSTDSKPNPSEPKQSTAPGDAQETAAPHAAESEETPRPRQRRGLGGRGRPREKQHVESNALTVVDAPEPSEPPTSGFLASIRSAFSNKNELATRDTKTEALQNGHNQLERGDYPTKPWQTKKSFISRAFAQESHPAIFPEEYYWYKFSDGSYVAAWRPLKEFDLHPDNNVSAVVLYNARYLQSTENCGLVDETSPEEAPMKHPERYHYYKYPDGFFVASREPLE